MERHAEKPLLVLPSCLLFLVLLLAPLVSAVPTPSEPRPCMASANSHPPPLFPLLVSAADFACAIAGSLRLGSHQQHPPPALKLSYSQDTTAIAAAMMKNTGRPTARVDVEVNDYQPSGPNNRHDPPKGPGRP
ncbi:hypothetical protein ZEAMMB73_Zm00001d038526 [Zea mays]|uniref:Uncharacterized protein n=1 Tax=Zea mays TaxID=4577 RepID=A0A1D6M6Y8_MAIZE|nr:hypothetical protein ZEAMMB73_Zm00001d038526 [Zea mays]